jgi:CRP-like cAMP-binding protein
VRFGSVLSHAGKEAIVATLGPGDFLGEAALAGHPVRLVTAVATSASTVFEVPERQMIRLLHTQHALVGSVHRLHVDARQPLEADLVDQLFNSSTRRRSVAVHSASAVEGGLLGARGVQRLSPMVASSLCEPQVLGITRPCVARWTRPLTASATRSADYRSSTGREARAM